MMKTRLQRTGLLRAARVLSAPKCSATMCLMMLLAILTFPTKAWAQETIAKIGDTPYESLQDAFDAAADGSTVTLLHNADIGEDLIDVTAGKGERNLTFDLKGFSLTGTKEPLYVRSGVTITIKGGTIGGPDADNACLDAISNLGGKVNIENLTISNCRKGIFNVDNRLDEETSIPGELTIGSGVKISATERCIDHYGAKLTLTALPMLSWGEEGYGIYLTEGKVINFAGEGITALPESFKPIMIRAEGELPRSITYGYAEHVKSGSEVIDPAKVFVGENDDISVGLYEGEAMMTQGSIQKVSVTKGDEVKQYLSLKDAFDAAADGSIVTLLENADIGEDLIDVTARKGERNLTFDLKGFSLTGTEKPLCVRSGVNITIKGGTIGGPDADNPCQTAISNLGGKVNIENLTISNCENGIYNGGDWLDEETSITGELTIGSGVNISAAERCIDHYGAKLSLTAVPMLSWGEEGDGIYLGEGKVINFASEGITALPEGFKPIRIWADGVFPCSITNGYAAHVKSGSEVIDPAEVFVGENDDISVVLYEGEAMMTYGSIQKVSVTKGDEVKLYFSLQAAFDKALDGSTVTLLEDADLEKDLIDIIAGEGERTLTFDLNGFSLTGTNNLLYVRSGINITIKGGTVGGPNAENPCGTAIRNEGGKVNLENLTISNCEYGIYNDCDWLDEETSIPGELTIGSGVNISATERCIDHSGGKLTLTALPILSWGEEGRGIALGEGQVINFAGEGITAFPEGFKPIKIQAYGELPRIITNGYADHVKSGSQVIDPAKVFVSRNNGISMALYEGEVLMTNGDIQMVSVTKGEEVKQYFSLKTAFDEAPDGSTVTLLDNADLGEYPIDISADEGDRNLTFDLKGFSLTGTNALLYVRSGVNITIKGGTIAGPDADNPCGVAIRNIGGKVNMENLTISNCEYGIYNEDDWLDEETSIPGELTIGSGVNISTTESCIDSEGKLTLTALPILSWGEEDCGIYLGEGQVINFAGEGITALPEGFKPIRIWADGVFPCSITNGYAAHVKSGSEVIDPAEVFVGEYDDISVVLYEGETVMTYGSIQKVSVTKGDEVKQYLSLQAAFGEAAFDEAADGSTVTLLEDANIGEDWIGIWADKGERNLTLDLNGYSLTATYNPLYVRSGVTITIKGGTIGSSDADNPCWGAIYNIGGKVNIENLTISNCIFGIYNTDEETSIPGELTIGSGVKISATESCIFNYEGELTLTSLPMLSWGEEGDGIYLTEGKVINFAGEGITALPEGFKPIKIWASGVLPRTITSGYSTFFKDIDPDNVFVVNKEDESIIDNMTLEGGEVVFSVKVSFPKGLSTFFSSYNLSVDNKDVKIYTVTAVEEGKVTVAEVKSKVIPSYMPVIISNESSETLFDPNFLNEEACQETFDNDIPDGVAVEFCGTHFATTLTNEGYDYFGFDGKDFVWMKDGSKVAPHRCWIQIPKENHDGVPVAARQLNIAWPNGDATSVQVQLSTVNSQLSSEVWYTLDGRKLKSRPTQKGIYIKKGKKVAIK